MPPQHCSYYSDNKRASVMSYKIGYVFLICQWLRPWKTSFWLSNERLKNINMAEQDKKKEPYSKSVSHSLHILLFVWCRYWVSSEKSGLRSLRMAASVCWGGIGMLYGTNASTLAWTSQQYPSTLSPSLLLSLYASLSISFSLSITIMTTTVWRKRCGLGLNVESCRSGHDCLPLMQGPPWQ